MTVAADSLPSVSTDHFQIGDRVLVGGTKAGIIVFVGEVHFSTGEWAGVVLDTPTGKNDGKIGGHRYFMCEPMRGVFCRLEKLTKLPGGGGNIPPGGGGNVPQVESGSNSRLNDATPASLGDFGLTARQLKNDSPTPHRSGVGASLKVADTKPPAAVVEKPSSPYQNTSSQQPDSGITTSSGQAETTSYSNGDDHMINRFHCSSFICYCCLFISVLQ